MSQTNYQVEKFTDRFGLTLDIVAESNSTLIVACGDFNIKSRALYINGGTNIKYATSKYELHQIINELKHVF